MIEKAGKYTCVHEDWVARDGNQKTRAHLTYFWRVQHLKIQHTNPITTQYRFRGNTRETNSKNADIASILSNCANKARNAQQEAQNQQNQFQQMMATQIDINATTDDECSGVNADEHHQQRS